MMNSLLKFINDNFRRMPRTVQVGVYIFIVLLFGYGYVAPHVITGRIVMKDSSGGEVHYRGQELSVDFAGHTLKSRTNEDGIWIIPAPFQSIRVRFDLAPFLGLEDQQSWHEITIGITDFWFRDVVKVVLSDNPPIIDVEPRFAAIDSAVDNFSRIARDLFANRAYAGMLQKNPGSPRGRAVAPVARPPTLWKKHARTEAQKTRRAIQNIISGITGIPSQAIADGFKLRRNPSLNFRKRVQIISRVEKQFGFRIPDEHWMSIKSVGELTTYVLDREKIYRQFKVEKNPDWYKYLRQIPRQERPIYKR